MPENSHTISPIDFSESIKLPLEKKDNTFLAPALVDLHCFSYGVISSRLQKYTVK